MPMWVVTIPGYYGDRDEENTVGGDRTEVIHSEHDDPQEVAREYVRDNLEREGRVHLNRVIETPTYHVHVSPKTEWVAATPVEVTKKVEKRTDKPDGAMFLDACNHHGPRDQFLGCVRLDGTAYDVYVFQTSAFSEMHVCLRFGNMRGDYLFHGTVESFIDEARNSTDPVYTATWPLVAKWFEEQRSNKLLPVHGMWPGSNANERFTFLGTVVSEDDRKFDVWIRTYAGEHRVYIRFDGGRYTYTDHGVVAEFLSKSSRSSVENIAVMMVRSWDAEQLSRSWAAGLGASAQKEKKS